MSEETEPIKDGELDKATRNMMQGTASALDDIFNGVDCPHEDKKYGFLVMVFPFSDENRRGNYISNCNRKDMITTMREFIARSPVETK